MRLSRKTDYGLILVEALKPTFRAGTFLTVGEIAQRYRLPPSLLEKLAELLKKGGYAEAKRGPGGGYRLRRDPKTITLKELLDVFEEPPLMRCLNKKNPEQFCPLVPICPTRKRWLKIDREISGIFETMTIDTL